MRKRNGKEILLILLPSLILLDQATKTWAIANLATVCNIGFAFGLWQGVANWLVVAVVLATIVVVITSEVRFRRFTPGVLVPWFPLEAGKNWRFWGLVLVIAGGASNIIDRVVRGCVVDWIDVGFWPAFNLADAVIVVGVGMILGDFLPNLCDRDKATPSR